MCMEHYAAGHQLSQYSNSASMWTLLEIQDIQQAGVYVPYHAVTYALLRSVTGCFLCDRLAKLCRFARCFGLCVGAHWKGLHVGTSARKLAGRHNNARQTPRAGSMHRFTQTPVTHLVPWCSNEVWRRLQVRLALVSLACWSCYRVLRQVHAEYIPLPFTVMLVYKGLDAALRDVKSSLPNEEFVTQLEKLKALQLRVRAVSDRLEIVEARPLLLVATFPCSHLCCIRSSCAVTTIRNHRLTS